MTIPHLESFSDERLYHNIHHQLNDLVQQELIVKMQADCILNTCDINKTSTATLDWFRKNLRDLSEQNQKFKNLYELFMVLGARHMEKLVQNQNYDIPIFIQKRDPVPSDYEEKNRI